MKKGIHKSVKTMILAIILAFFVGGGGIILQANGIFAINFDSYTVNIGDENKLELEINGTLPDNASVKWTSWNENVATVDQVEDVGIVTPLKKGKAIISSGVGFPRETCLVTVVEPSLKLNMTSAALYCAPSDTAGRGGAFGGKTVQLKATAKGADNTVVWSSSNEKVAVVDGDGLVTSIGEGSVRITASANGQKETCNITVKKNDINLNLKQVGDDGTVSKVPTVKLGTKGAGSSMKLVPTVVGANSKITWKSNNPKVATVSNGKITGKRTGLTYITATANGVEARCIVMVQENMVSIDQKYVCLYATKKESDSEKTFGQVQLKANTSGAEKVTWKSDKPEVAEVDETSGHVTAKGTGTATISVMNNDKETDTCTVEVKDTETELSRHVLHMKTTGAAKTYTVSCSVTGENNTVKWDSSDKKIVTVNKGKLTAKKVGEATITAEANGIKDTLKVYVEEPDPTITLSQSEYTLYTAGKGNKVTLKAKVDGASKAVEWKSYNEDVATVKNGKVTATAPKKDENAEGSQPGHSTRSALITATANGVTANCIIRVKETDIIPEKNYYVLKLGEKDRIDVNVIGENQTVKFKSASSKTVAVDKNGNITGKNVTPAGGTKIDMTANGMTVSCYVFVTNCDPCSFVPVKDEDKAKDDREATCEKTGLTTYVCEICGVKKQDVTPPKGHDFGRWTVTVKATETSSGVEEQVCKVCGLKNTRSVPAKNKADIADAYQLVWSDEFDGTELNLDDWNFEYHEPGWVNSELQEYVDSKENTFVKDGMLYIKAIERVDANGNPIREERDGRQMKTYTSGRINTQKKHDFQYGRFEVRAKVPSGSGFLPAFWMMPTDESYYGQWPKCGEIDIMEVHGSALNTTYSTLHFGEPHTQKQGSLTLSGGAKNFYEEFHVFACEWDPGEFRFYMDDKLFYTVNDWFTQKPGFGKVAYPAPYDQPFYLILNLAVGGSWVGWPGEDDVFGDNAQFIIDYVRVYQKDSYDTDVDKPENKVTLREPDSNGNYVINGDFSTVEDLSKEEDVNWQLLLAGGGEATAAISDNALHITTTNAGTLNYSVQVVQANLPMENGAKYELTYDAYADEARTMITGISAPDRGYSRYLSDTTVNLTTEKQSFKHEFSMTDDSDANGRLEFNLGNQNSVAAVHISNVVLKKAGAVEKEVKGMLPDGNYVYNGQFNEGNEPGRRRLEYWDWNTNKCRGAEISVTDDSIRELKVTVPDSVASLDHVKVYQEDIAITGGKKYILSFDAYADRAKTIKATVASQTFDAELTNEKKNFKYELTTPADLKGSEIAFLLGTPGTVYIDNVAIREDSLIVNGDFSSGELGYTVYVGDNAKVPSYVVDSLNEKNALAIDITDTSADDWQIQVKQEGVKLEKDKWYKLSIDAKATMEREIMFALQRDGTSDNDWTPYSGQPKAQLTGTWQTFSKVFQMTSKTDPNTILSISMGAVGGKRITDKHTVLIDNIVLEETEPVEEPPVETGKNLIENGDFAEADKNWKAEIGADAAATTDFSGNKAVFNITNVGTRDWDVKLSYTEPLTLEKDAEYKVTMKIMSTAARTVKYSFMTPSYAWYGGQDLVLAANEIKEVDYTFKVEDHPTSNEIAFGISMGQIYEDDKYTIPIDTPASTIEVSDISVIKVGGETPAPVDPDNIIKNGNFAKEKESWNDYVDAKASAKTSFTGNKARYEIFSAGEADWNIQLKQEGLALEKGAKYKVNFKIASSADRTVRLAIMGANNTWCGGTDIDLTGNKLKSFSQIMTLNDDYTEGTVAFQLSLGQIGETALGEHAVEISDVSIKKVDDSAVKDEVEDVDHPVNPPAKNLIKNGDFAAGEENWVTDYCLGNADASRTIQSDSDGKWFRYEIIGAGDADWNVQLKQEGLALEKGAKYKVNFKIASSIDRQVKVAIMGAENAWCDGADITLTGNKLKSFSQIMALNDNYTEGTVALQISMGLPEGVTRLDPHAIEISDISIIKVDDSAVADKIADTDKAIKQPAESLEIGTELIKNGDFMLRDRYWTVEQNTTETSTPAATTDFTGKKAQFTITSGGSDIKDIRLTQKPLKLDKGALYRVNLKIESSNDRTVKVGFTDSAGTAYGNEESITLHADRMRTVSRIITVDKKTSDNIVFQICMGKVEGEAEVSAITIQDISIKKVASVDDKDVEDEEPGPETPEINLIKSGKFENKDDWKVAADSADSKAIFKSGTARFEIFDVKNAEDHVYLKQESLNLVKGKKYRVQFDIASSDDRKVEISLLGMDAENKYTIAGGSAKINLSTNEEKSVDRVIQLGNDCLDEKPVAFAILMGKVDSTTSEPHAIEISNVKIVEVSDDTTVGQGTESSRRKVVDRPNMLENGDFANGETGWKTTFDTGKIAKGQVTYSDGKARIEIYNTGTNDWDIQLTSQTNLTLEKGEKYKVSFKAASSVDNKKVRVALTNMAEGADYASWGGIDATELKAGKQQLISKIITVEKDTANKIQLQICMGNFEEQASSRLEPHAIEIDDISITKVETDVTADKGIPTDVEIAPVNNLIMNGNFAKGGAEWNAITEGDGQGASAINTYSDDKAKFNISNVGTDEWHISLKQTRIILKKGASYQFKMKINSTKARTIKYVFQNSAYDWYGGGDIEIKEDGGQKEVDYSFTVDKDTCDDITFQISMGLMKERNDKGELTGNNIPTPSSEIEISEISLIKMENASRSTESDSLKSDMENDKKPETESEEQETTEQESEDQQITETEETENTEEQESEETESTETEESKETESSETEKSEETESSETEESASDVSEKSTETESAETSESET